MEPTTIHAFEEAELGKAPFRVINVYDEGYRNKGNGEYHTSCAYCFTQIRNIFEIQSADGKIFPVGSECVKKTGDKGLINTVRQMITQKQAERLENDYTWAIGNYNQYATALDAMPHPWTSNKSMYDFISACESRQINIYSTTKKAVVKAVREAKKIMGGQTETSIEQLLAAKKAKQEAELEEIRKQKEELQAEQQRWDNEYAKGLDNAANLPHPNAYFAKRGKTLRDYIDFMLSCGMAKNSAKVIEAIRMAGANI